MASEDTPKMQGRGTNAAPQRRAGAKPAATGSDKKPAKAAKPAQDPAKAAAKPATRRVKAADKPAEVDVAAGAPKARAKAAGSTAKGATKPASRPARSTAKPRKAAAATAKKPVAKASGNAPAPARSLADLADGMARDAAVARMPAAPKPAPKPAATPAPTPAPEAGAGQPQEEPARASSPFAENLERIEALTQRLASALSRRTIHDPGIEGPGADLMVNAGMAMARLWAGQPAKILEQQVKYWGATFAHYAEMQSHLARGKLTVPPDDTPETDKRFKNPLWQSHPFFNMIKTQYQINSKAMRDAASGLDMENEVDQHRLGWLTNQVIDMFAPTNFFATNPDAIERALETEGESLVKGLENLVRDIEANKGDLVVSLADRNAFAVGENIGTAPGRVVRRERLFELIQFSPSTDQVHETPVILFPPWINKFYILDLKPENSLIRWIVDQGYTLFVLSWKNPDTSYAETSLEDYVSAYLSAMDAVLEITGQPRLNAVGYCIGGTTLGLTLGLMAQKGDRRVASATFFTTLTDFSEQGEFTPFLQNDFVDGITAEVDRAGVFAAQLMSRTMSFLRANDLVWGPAIRSYMMGETPPAFDLLYWNGDATNLPGKMTVDYLRGLCQQNLLVDEGFPVLGHNVTLKDITLPLCAIGCETDHIAPWKYSWRGVAQMGSPDKRFILSESGHIAGIINPPSKKKYGHYAGGEDFSAGPEAWREASGFQPGSWWPTWEAWLAGHSGAMVPARAPDDGFGPAPGTYVHERA